MWWPVPIVPRPSCTAEVERPVLSHHPPQCSSHCSSWNHRCGAQIQDALLCKCQQSHNGANKSCTCVASFATQCPSWPRVFWSDLPHSCNSPSVSQCRRNPWALLCRSCTTWPQASPSRPTSPDSTAPLVPRRSWSQISSRGSMSFTPPDKVSLSTDERWIINCTEKHISDFLNWNLISSKYPLVFSSSQVSVQYSLLFTSWWPTSLYHLAPVSKETTHLDTEDESIADDGSKRRWTTVVPRCQHPARVLSL